MRLNDLVPTASTPSPPPAPDPLVLTVMDVRVSVDLTGALDTHRDAVRRAWSRCLPGGGPQNPTGSPEPGRSPAAATRSDRAPAAPAATPPDPAAAAPAAAPRPVNPAPARAHVAVPAPATAPVPAAAQDAGRSGVHHIVAPAGCADPAVAMESLTTAVTLAGIERHRGRSLMFHAAGLADPVTGGTAVLVAASGTGKTTAARRLGRDLGYVSDETVCVDPADLGIAPYPKPLSVVRGPGEPKEQVSPDDLGLHPLRGPAALRALLLLERDPAQEHPHVTDPLPLVTALATLVPNISALPALPRPLRTLVRAIDACGGVRAVRYREIDDVAAHVHRLATVPAVPTERPRPLRAWAPDPAAPARPGPHDPAATPDSAAGSPRGEPTAHGERAASSPAPRAQAAAREQASRAPGGGHVVPGERAGGAHADAHPAETPPVALGPWVEALENPEDPSQLLVLLPEHLVVLAGIAPVVWHVCREHGPQAADSLREMLDAACGPHPESARLTRECVGELLSLGVLREVPGPEESPSSTAAVTAGVPGHGHAAGAEGPTRSSVATAVPCPEPYPARNALPAAP